MNFSDEFDYGYKSDDLYDSRIDRARKPGKVGRPKKEDTALPKKPGNWKSLGVRPKFDPRTNEPTTAEVWKDETLAAHFPEPPKREAARAAGGSDEGRRMGRPAGRRNRNKDRYAVNWDENVDITEAPVFSHSYQKQTARLQERYNKPSAHKPSPYKSVGNILGPLQTVIEGTLMKVRDDVMAQCSWSLPTYYRKQYPEAKVSNAEAEMIGKIVITNMEWLNSQVTELVEKSRPVKIVQDARMPTAKED